jgi:ribosomal protein L11 methyltransferase
MSTEDKSLSVLTVEVTKDRVEEVQSWIEASTDVTAVQLEKPHWDSVWLEVYFEEDIEARLTGAALQQEFGLPFTIRECAQADWSTFWQHHFKPQAIGKKIWICPIWEDAEAPDEGRITVKINPGLSFGTGEHFTTRFCLDALDSLCADEVPARIFDAGAGSAIIGITAALLGCPEIIGVEHDPLAVANARENIALNGVSEQVTVEEMDLTENWVSGTYPVVFANLFSGLLMELAPRLVRTAEKHLIITGIRSIEADAVGDTFTELGAREMRRDGDHEWCGMMFEV